MNRLWVMAFLISIVGCQLPQVIRPLRLYDLNDGASLEVFLSRTSANTGTLESTDTDDGSFHGEYVFYQQGAAGINPSPRYGQMNLKETGSTLSADASFAELYGFGKDSEAKPAGTAILVGNDGTVIEIVLYRVGPDLQYGDGIAKDNKGRRYRVFLSHESL